MARIQPIDPPYDHDTGSQLAKMMPPGVEPIRLFRTFAKNLPMTAAMGSWGSYELSSKLSLSMRDREILIDRTCARCGCEYEWGVHIAFFADRVRLSTEQIASITHGSVDDECWTDDRDRLLIRTADALHDHATIDDQLHRDLITEFAEAGTVGHLHALRLVPRHQLRRERRRHRPRTRITSLRRAPTGLTAKHGLRRSRRGAIALGDPLPQVPHQNQR